MADPEAIAKRAVVRELLLALGFLALVAWGALTVASPELSDAPESEAATASDLADQAGAGALGAGGGPPPSTP